MLTKLITKVIGDPNEKEMKRCLKIVESIKQQEASFSSLDEEGVKAQTQTFKDRLANGETLDDLLPEAFALVKHTCTLLKGKSFDVRGHKLTWEMVPYDVQLVGAIILHEGKIAEMKTGEGKTLVATLPMYLNALTGKGCYLVTVNDYLARRDAEWMGVLYSALGLTTGVIYHGQSPEEKKAAYEADITYGTNNEFGFDYLRDNMAVSLDMCVQREPHYAIVDEVDSILIDEARTPLIISAPAEQSTEKYQKYAQLVTQLNKDEHFTLDEKSRTCIMTDEGVRKMEGLLGMENIYTEAGASEVHHIEQALKARMLFQKDVHYMVRENQVVIIDEFTGRLMPGRRFSEGLHQAIEAKENVEIKKESRTLATITFQNYFRLFDKLAGMTGTAITEAEEFDSIYSLQTLVIPTNKPIARQDLNDQIFRTVYGKFQAVTREVKAMQEKGQPVLVGTISVEKSELLSKMFQQSGIRHEVLNAKHHEREAEIVARAGEKDSVTIATNMAGRGTDIKINDEVKSLGGLAIIGTERHESRRIDNQLRGRSGRQGDPGSSQFFVSMEDELMRLFGGDRMRSIMETLKVPEDQPIENGFITRSIESAQKRVEGHNFDIRKHLVEYDDVMNKHRTIVYKRRRKILESENIHETIVKQMSAVVDGMAQAYLQGKHHEDWQKEELIDAFHSLTGIPKSQYAEQIKQSTDRQTLSEHLISLAQNSFDAKRENVNGDDTFFKVERQVALRTIDQLWMDHITAMMKLREQVSFRGYAQKNPLVEYKNDGFAMFEKLMANIQSNTVQTLMRMEVKKEIPREQIRHMRTNEKQIVDIETGDREFVPTPQGTATRPTKVSADDHSGHDPQIKEQVFGAAQPSSDSGNVVRVSADADEGVTVRQAEPQEQVPKVGRNEPCPCGSGKKYKKCHGK